MLIENPKNIAEQVYRHIKKKILSGELRGGQRISEEGIGEIFGVSRTPIREAFKRLETYGLVRVKPRSYAEVVHLDKEELDKITVVRATIECLAVKILAQNITPEIANELKEKEKQCREALLTGDLSAVFEMDSQFHLAIAHNTKNEYIHDILERIDAKVQLYRASCCINIRKVENDIHQHQQIVEAICSMNEQEAIKRMENHIFGVL